VTVCALCSAPTGGSVYVCGPCDVKLAREQVGLAHPREPNPKLIGRVLTIGGVRETYSFPSGRVWDCTGDGAEVVWQRVR
jgi:hypothetical protein